MFETYCAENVSLKRLNMYNNVYLFNRERALKVFLRFVNIVDFFPNVSLIRYGA